MARRAGYIKSIIGEEGRYVIVLDAGNVFASSGLQAQIKAEIAIEAMEMMSYNVFNFGNNDFYFGVDFLLNYTDQFNVPTINANVVYEDTGKNITAPSKIVQFDNLMVGLIGIVSQEYAGEILQSNFINTRSIMVLDETLALQTEIDNIKNDVDIIVVLAHVGMEDSIAIAEDIEGIDVIICGNGNEEVPLLQINGVYIVKNARDGRKIGKLALWLDENNNLYNAEGNIILLSSSYDEDVEVQALVDEYNDRLEARKDELLNIEQVAPDSGWYYTGYSTCAGCHSAQIEQWYYDDTDHAVAFTSLIEMGQEYNSECFDCHTNGFGYIGGFVMSDTTPEMEGVQCEMCHGAGGEHSESPSAPFGQTSVSTCTNCHTQERNPDFYYATYYPRVLHFHTPGDYDNDGIDDNVDNCWEAFNPDQEDEDGDGLGDVCDECTDTDGDSYGNPGFPYGTCPLDNCPDVSNADQTDSDADGLGDVCDNCPNDPENDLDTDGVCGDIDNCPEIANTNQLDSDGDCIGDVCDEFPVIYDQAQPDHDADGLGDVCDNCPEDYNPEQADVGDGDGTGDICDNCPTISNGPDLGTCVKEMGGVLTGTGIICTIGGGECGSGETCQMQQEDYNQNGIGDACECYADFNNDGIVSTPDLDLYEAEYYQTPCDPTATNGVPPAPGCCRADGNNDGIVSTPDLDLFEAQFYHLCPDRDPCPNVP